MGDFVQKKLYLMYFIAVFMKLTPLSFVYRPLQDDYIQYFGYSHYPDVFRDVIRGIGILNVRPLAGLADVFLWGNFWGNMSLLLILFTIIYYLSFVLFKSTFDKIGFNVSDGFAAVYLLCPIGFEGMYWISASSRIVVSMFFISLMLWALVREKPVLFGISALFGVGFYEQTAFLGLCMTVILLFICAKRGYFIKKYILMSIIIWTLFIVYYILFSRTGMLAERVEKAEFSFESLAVTVSEIVRGWKTSSVLIYEGFKSSWIIILLVGVFSVLIGFSSSYEKRGDKVKQFAVGAVIFCASYVVHIVIGADFIPYRCHLPALIGLGLMADSIIGAMNINIKRAVITVMIFLFTLANMYQADCYRRINEYDSVICKEIAEGINEDNKREDMHIQGTKSLYIEVPTEYERYILKNVTESDWALTGAVRAVSKDMEIKKVIPVRKEQSNEG